MSHRPARVTTPRAVAGNRRSGLGPAARGGRGAWSASEPALAGLRAQHDPPSAEPRGCRDPPDRVAPRPSGAFGRPYRAGLPRGRRGRSPRSAQAFRADIMAVVDRDPACNRLLEPVLYFKGFHAIQTHRLAHWLWNRGRQDFALYLQSRSSEVFQTDIHPAARIGTRHLPRPRDRPRGRLDGRDRGRRLDAAGRDARRHRQGARRPASEDPARAS